MAVYRGIEVRAEGPGDRSLEPTGFRASLHMFIRELRQAGHVRRFTITEAPGEGWEVREEADSELVSRTRYRDWHRVERAKMLIDERVSELEDSGWS